MKVHLEYVTADGTNKKVSFEVEVDYVDHARDPFGTAVRAAKSRIRQTEGWGTLDVKSMSVSYEDN